MKCIIIAGGSGERLWPLSRPQQPKQFHCLNDPQLSMLQETLQRVLHADSQLDISDLCVVASEEHRFLVAEQLRQAKLSGVIRDNVAIEILLEPCGRNTAPAITLAALQASQPDELLLVLPADHRIDDAAAFQQAVKQGSSTAQAGKLVTFGIVPEYAATGYGYIQTDNGSAEDRAAEEGSQPVTAFIEKPDQATAEAYLKSGEYLWNSGMFLFRADRYLDELSKTRADILQACESAWQQVSRDLDFLRPDATAFSQCPSESVDYALFEPVSQTDPSAVRVIPLAAGWNDLGSWSALIQQAEERGTVSQDNVVSHDSQDCHVFADQCTVALLGTENLLVVDTADALLIANRDRLDEMKVLVSKLKQRQRFTGETRTVYRPWGKYTCVDSGPGYQIKRISVQPGGQLSLQRHQQRAEHWVVIAGTAEVTNNQQTFTLQANQSAYIPQGGIHRLSNPGDLPLELIEVQSGEYLGEDDIERLEDVYGRADLSLQVQLQ